MNKNKKIKINKIKNKKNTYTNNGKNDFFWNDLDELNEVDGYFNQTNQKQVKKVEVDGKLKKGHESINKEWVNIFLKILFEEEIE